MTGWFHFFICSFQFFVDCVLRIVEFSIPNTNDHPPTHTSTGAERKRAAEVNDEFNIFAAVAAVIVVLNVYVYAFNFFSRVDTASNLFVPFIVFPKRIVFIFFLLPHAVYYSWTRYVCVFMYVLYINLYDCMLLLLLLYIDSGNYMANSLSNNQFAF